MNDMNKAEIQRIIDARLEDYGLTRLARMFAVEHNVPRGTHKTNPAGPTGPTGPAGP